MQHTGSMRTVVALCAGVLLAATAAAPEAQAQDFFANKKITIMIGSSAAGG